MNYKKNLKKQKEAVNESIMRVFLFLFLSASLFAETYKEPEHASHIHEKKPRFAKKYMVVSANKYASEAGAEILEKGGNAVDAAIAMQMVLNVVEPQSSGIGGGAFCLYFRNRDKKALAFDGRETAPSLATEDLFLDENKKPIAMAQAIIGGRSVGTPGILKMLEALHQKEGKLSWSMLFEKAIFLAENGFPISERLHLLIQKTANLKTFPETAHFLFENGAPKKVGALLKNPQLAETFRLIAREGSAPFYHGKIADEIVERVQNCCIKPGLLALKDLADYHAIQREPLVLHYKGYEVFGFPPPSSGIAVLQILGMLNEKEIRQYKMGSLDFINLFCSASKLAFADRNYYIADPDFVRVPAKSLLTPIYLKKRAKLLDPKESVQQAKAGLYYMGFCPHLFLSPAYEFPSTSQICVVDSDKNAISMTTSIENAFGSTLMAGGFFLNNQLTDFSFLPEKEGKKAANRIEPKKRPMSAMSPTFVFRDGRLALVTGSAGGARIINYVAQILLGVLDFQENIQEAIAFPHYTALIETLDLEKNTFLESYQESLEQMGNSVKIMPLTSGSSGIQITEEGLIGGADPRREGVALGH